MEQLLHSLAARKHLATNVPTDQIYKNLHEGCILLTRISTLRIEQNKQFSETPKSADALELRITTVTRPVPIVSACYSLGAWESVRFVPCFCTLTTENTHYVILRQVNMKELGNSKAHACIVDQHSTLLNSTQPGPRR